MSKEPSYILNPDCNHVERIKSAIEKIKGKTGFGYCPCVIPSLRNEDTICPCLTYRTSGHCHCKLYLDETSD